MRLFVTDIDVRDRLSVAHKQTLQTDRHTPPRRMQMIYYSRVAHYTYAMLAANCNKCSSKQLRKLCRKAGCCYGWDATEKKSTLTEFSSFFLSRRCQSRKKESKHPKTGKNYFLLKSFQLALQWKHLKCPSGRDSRNFGHFA